MDQIAQLTDEQQKTLQDTRDYWLSVGLSTEPINLERAKAAMKLVYSCAGLPEPKLFLVMDNPFHGAIAAHLLTQLRDQVGFRVKGQVGFQIWNKVGSQVRSQVGNKVGNKIRDQVRSQVWDQVGDHVRSQVRDQIEDQVGSQVGSQVGFQVWEQVREQVRDQLGPQVGNKVGNKIRDQVRSQVWDQVGDHVRSQVRDQIEDQIWDQVWDRVRSQLYKAVFGSQDADWLAFLSFFLNEFNIGENARGLIAAAKECGWYWPFEKTVIITNRPSSIFRDENNLLHRDDGPALDYNGTFRVYAWHGTRVPSHWIENRTSLDPVEVLACENVEQRAAGAQIVGWGRMADKLNRRIIDGDPDTDIGALIELTLPGLNKPGRFLQAVCPRNGTIVEGVPNVSDIDGKPIETAIAAQAWRDGLPVSEYQHPILRT